MIEIPPQFADMPPVNPEARKTKSLIEKEWKGVEGLISDIEYYGQRVHEKAVERLGLPDPGPLRGREVVGLLWRSHFGCRWEESREGRAQAESESESLELVTSVRGLGVNGEGGPVSLT